MTGYRVTTRGRYKCSFCEHPSYKRMGGVLGHIRDKHELELANATIEEMRGTIDRLKKQPPKVVEKERIVYRDPPAKPKAEKKFWTVSGLYCSTCKTAQRGGGIPVGQTIEETPHSVCGTKSLMLILNGDFM